MGHTTLPKQMNAWIYRNKNAYKNIYGREPWFNSITNENSIRKSWTTEEFAALVTF